MLLPCYPKLVFVSYAFSAASGFGHAFAKRAVKENMKLVLADLNYAALVEKTKELDVSPDRVCFVECDVSKKEDIEKLANTAFDTFGGVHLLFNNAGVAHAQLSWEHTEDGKLKLDI
jgi:NAD(P)-dependent dehydrogenase (short-subunit alcohol dehydrogenase family)